MSDYTYLNITKCLINNSQTEFVINGQQEDQPEKVMTATAMVTISGTTADEMQ